MPSAQDSFTIDVNLNGSSSSPTSPSRKAKSYNPTSVSGFLKDVGVKNGAAYAMMVGAGISLGKTYIDLQFSKSENANKATRFAFSLKLVGYAGTIAGGAALGGPIGAAGATVYVAASITGDVLTYNTKLQKLQLRFDYTNDKYKQNVADGSRFRGGSL